MAELTSLLFSEIFGDKVTTTPVLEEYPNWEKGEIMMNQIKFNIWYNI